MNTAEDPPQVALVTGASSGFGRMIATELAHAGHPADQERVDAYRDGYPHGFADRVLAALAATDPPGSDPTEIGRAVARIATMPAGTRPFRTVIDPADDGSAVSFPVVDRVRSEFVRRIGFPEMLGLTAT